MRRSTILGLVGCALGTAGIALFDWRLGLIVAGVILFAMGMLSAIEEGKKPG